MTRCWHLGGWLSTRSWANIPEALCSVDVNKSSGEQRLINSVGIDVGHHHTNSGFFMEVELIRGTDMLSIWDGIVTAKPINQLNVNGIVAKLLRRLHNSQNIVDAPSGKDLPVVFAARRIYQHFPAAALVGFQWQERSNRIVTAERQMGREDAR